MLAVEIPRSRRKARLWLGCLLLLSGVYFLFVLMTPTVRTVTLNPQNNHVTKRLAEPAPPEQAQLYIPKIGLSVPFGKSVAALDTGAWWRKPENGSPDTGGNFVLAGHRFQMRLTPQSTLNDSPFYSVDKLAVGDAIVVDYNQKRYEYTVSEIYTVAPEAVEIEARTAEPRLTLYTCTLSGSNDGREVIIAVPRANHAIVDT